MLDNINMTNWNPNQYLKFQSCRIQPAIDLVSRIELESPKIIIDLGCGTGTSTGVLRAQWPNAKIIGIDSSSEMLEEAQRTDSSVEWIQTDLNDWQPNRTYDLIFSNAALQWIKSVEGLLSLAIDSLSNNGAVAFQVPNNERSPYHRCIIELAESAEWRDTLEQTKNPLQYNSMDFYYELLAFFK